GDDPRRLVEQHVRELLPGQWLSVEAHVVVRGDERVQPPRLAVDRDPPRLDQLVGLAARGDSRARQPGVQPHSGMLHRRGVRRRLAAAGSQQGGFMTETETAPASAVLDADALNELREGFRGEIVEPGDAGYDE